jgi:hypothetical protein
MAVLKQADIPAGNNINNNKLRCKIQVTVKKNLIKRYNENSLLNFIMLKNNTKVLYTEIKNRFIINDISYLITRYDYQ